MNLSGGPINSNIQELLGESRIQEAISSQEFYYEKARNKFQEFLDLRLDNTILKQSREGESVYESLILEFDYVRKEKSFGEFLEGMDPDSEKHKILLTIGQLIAYLDSRGYNKSEWNEYEDKRCVARANVYQHLWIINLLKFKAQGNNFQVVSPNIFNSLQFLNIPDSSLPVISNDHREKISIQLMEVDYREDYFIADAFSYFKRNVPSIPIINRENSGVVYAMIFYHPLIRTIWDHEYKTRKEEAKSEESEIDIEEAIYNSKYEEIEEEADKEIAEIIASISGKPAAQADKTAKKDLLGRDKLIEAMSAMISSSDQGTPFTIGIFGNWGAGKSSVVELAQARLKNYRRKRYWYATFNAWRCEHVGNIAAGLAQETVKGLINKLWVPRKLLLRLQVAFIQHRWSTILSIAGMVITSWLLIQGMFHEPPLEEVSISMEEKTISSSPLDSLSTITLKTSQKRIVEKAGYKEEVSRDSTSVDGRFETLSETRTETITDDAGKTEQLEKRMAGWGSWLDILLNLLSGGGLIVFVYFLKKLSDNPLLVKFISNARIPNYSEQLGLVEQLREQIRVLTRLLVRGNDRLVVFIDDLDRCSKETIIKTFEAVRLVMDLKNTIIIIAIDQRIALVAIADKYRAFVDATRTKQDVARDYLGKLIQLPIQLSEPDQEHIERFVRKELFKKYGKLEQRGDSLTEESVSSVGGSTDPEEAQSEGAAGSVVKKGETQTPQVPANPSDQVQEGNKGAGTGGQQYPISEETLQETEEEINHFIRYTEFFRLKNPRQIRRLRNCYRVLKNVEEGSDSLKLMFMLFLLEHLYSHYSKTKIQERSIDFDPEIFADHQFNKKISAEIIALGIQNLHELEKRAQTTTLPCMSYVANASTSLDKAKKNLTKTRKMKCIVVLSPESDPWRVLDTEFESCPPSPVEYSKIYVMSPLNVIDECDEVEIRNSNTGRIGKGFPLIIEE